MISYTIAVLLMLSSAVLSQQQECPGLGDLPNEGRIVFASDVDGDLEIFKMRADGTNIKQLTFNDSDDYDPKWSPNGRRIVFTHESKKRWSGVYLMSRRGTNITRFADGPYYEDDAEWSPDGKWIAFEGNNGGDGSDVIARRVDGTKGLIVAAQESNSSNGEPTWSPDGTEIALVESYDGYDVFIHSFPSYDTGRRVTTNWELEETNIDWSPDGESLLISRAFYESRPDASPSHIYVVDPDDGSEYPVLGLERGASIGSWSPEGDAFILRQVSDHGDASDLFIARPCGGEPLQLTDTVAHETTPDWWGPASEK